jgi:hypothetical protein
MNQMLCIASGDVWWLLAKKYIHRSEAKYPDPELLCFNQNAELQVDSIESLSLSLDCRRTAKSGRGILVRERLDEVWRAVSGRLCAPSLLHQAPTSHVFAQCIAILGTIEYSKIDRAGSIT